MKGDKKLEIQTPDVPPCDFCGEASGVRCLVESAARYCPNAPTLDQILASARSECFETMSGRGKLLAT